MQIPDPSLVPLGVDRSLAAPLFRQIADSFEGAIQSGELTDGDRVESETDLAARLGVSRPTVRQALQELVEKGLVSRRRGVGTVVVAGESGGPDDRAPQDDSPRFPAQAGRLLGVTVPDLSNPFFAGLVQSIEKVARRRGLMLVVSDTEEDTMGEARAIRGFSDSVSQLILVAPRLGDAELDAVLGTRLPAVLINRNLGDRPRVNADVRPGIAQALGHLRALGHTDIGYVGGPEASRAGREIKSHLETSARDYQCRVRMLSHVPATHAGGYAVGDVVIASEVTAVVAHNDLIALGLVSRLAERGVRVPEDISIIGIDDIPFAVMSSPSLTSIAIDRQAMGRLAVEMLLDRPGGSTLAQRDSTIPSHLVVRGSTGVSPVHSMMDEGIAR